MMQETMCSTFELKFEHHLNTVFAKCRQMRLELIEGEDMALNANFSA